MIHRWPQNMVYRRLTVDPQSVLVKTIAQHSIRLIYREKVIPWQTDRALWFAILEPFSEI